MSSKTVLTHSISTPQNPDYLPEKADKTLCIVMEVIDLIRKFGIIN